MGAELENSKRKIKKLLRENTIREFEGCAGHRNGFFTDDCGFILKEDKVSVDKIQKESNNYIQSTDGITEGDIVRVNQPEKF